MHCFGRIAVIFQSPHGTGFASRFRFVELTLGRMPIFTRRFRAGTFLTQICTVVEDWHHGYFCLGYFFSSTHFNLVTLMSLKALRQCVLVFVYDVGYRAGNCNGLLANTDLFLSIVNRYLFLLNAGHSLLIIDHCSCFKSPVSGESFGIKVSDLYSSIVFILRYLGIDMF